MSKPESNTSKTSKPELLAPAGDFERLRFAVAYGADAVYLGARQFSLRAQAKNFDETEIEEAVSYAHSHGVKVYVAVNSFARDEDFSELEKTIRNVRAAGADALILSDLGVFALVREIAPEMQIHISTQANTTNSSAVRFWQRNGANRVILARELSLKEISHIQADGIELETFVHGAMCMAYSGRCLLSLAMTGRDANRGACAHPCRYSYALTEETRPGEHWPVEVDGRGSYILSAQDLCMIEYLPLLIEAGISSFKIEGRMKSSYYVAAVVKAYREAIDDYLQDPLLYEEKKNYYLNCLLKTGHREFSAGFYFGRAEQSVGQEHCRGESTFVAVVRSYDESSGCAVLEQRNKFSVGEELEFLTARGSCFSQRIIALWDKDGAPIQDAPHAQQYVKMQTARPVQPMDILRRNL